MKSIKMNRLLEAVDSVLYLHRLEKTDRMEFDALRKQGEVIYAMKMLRDAREAVPDGYGG